MTDLPNTPAAAHALVALLACFAASACDPAPVETDAGVMGSDAAPDAGPRTIGRGEVCAEAARVVCGGSTDCCPSGSVADCESRMESWCQDSFGAALDLPAAAFDPDEALAAIEVAEGLVAICDPAIIEWMYEPDGIAAMFRGAGDDGTSCHTGDGEVTFEEQLSCAGGTATTCLTGAAGMDGVCGARLGRDMACRADFDCRAKFRCGFAGASRECISREGRGEPCDARLECESLICGIPDGSTLDECLARTAESVYCGGFL